jgi:hypothetical protein
MKVFLILPLLLAACVSAPLAPEGTDYVELYSGGPPWGLTRKVIYANDTLFEEKSYYSEGNGESWRRLPEGTYARVRAVVEEKMPQVRQPARDDLSACPEDGGSYSVTVQPPVAGRDRVGQPCVRVPGLQVYDFMAAIGEVIPE